MKTVAEANLEASKLDVLASQRDMTVSAFIEAYALESRVPGICMHANCEYTAEVEPDGREGWCDCCGDRSVKSCLVLAGLI
jgi:hypothetical protein